MRLSTSSIPCPECFHSKQRHSGSLSKDACLNEVLEKVNNPSSIESTRWEAP